MDFGRPSRRAAPDTPPASATATKVSKSARSVTCVPLSATQKLVRTRLVRRYPERKMGSNGKGVKTMSNILVINSSAAGRDSVSRVLVADAVSKLLEADPAAMVTHRDLGENPPPHLISQTLNGVRGEPRPPRSSLPLAACPMSSSASSRPPTPSSSVRPCTTSACPPRCARGSTTCCARASRSSTPTAPCAAC